MHLVREPGVITPALIDLLRGEFRLDWNGAHGVAHWARVRVNGLRLALHNGADMRVVEYFSFLHDACRRNAHNDPEHGLRAAMLAHAIRHSHIALEDEAFSLLVMALEGHTHSTAHDNLTVCTCWDADRLDLARVGITPDPNRMCTHEGKDPAMIARCTEAARSWLRHFLAPDDTVREIVHTPTAGRALG
jgi:uncharacterized protein